ncbi:hypothetical protein G3580_18310 [Nitrogeniibacter mangrovi]|uniref:Uncharacterized protein n=1 Tax=Nitrogeniibacter mangrovi TaxID=2016596 RepID=A0A6C1B7E8_9RHOO|nr:hypothetical protein [Nitrogeniibacter mangrovi]QID19397.1 hypothetical protein G3580_18310 [Nitrogeniibacter mangrovi]
MKPNRPMRQPSSNERGAILLHTLVLLALMATLLLIIVANSNRGIDTARAVDDRVARQADMDSIIDLVVYDIVREGVRSGWLQKSAAFVSAPAPYQDYKVRVVDVRGLVDVNDGAVDLVRAVLADISIDASRQWKRRTGARYRNLVDFAHDTHLDANELFCLSVNATTHSRRSEPGPRFAPKSARHFIRQRSEHPNSVMEEFSGGVAGQAFQIVVLTPDNFEAYELTAYVTGRIDLPILVREVLWLPSQCAGLEHL